LACAIALSLSVVGCDKTSSEDEDEDEDDETEEPQSRKDKSSSDDKAMVAQGAFSGTWQTAWGKVTLVQAGSKVGGTYAGKFTGSLDGLVSDDEVTLTWIQTNGERGKATFTLAKDGQSFTGTWGNRTSATNGGAWNGKRLK